MQKGNSFVSGASILFVSGLVSKVIGAFYKIWLAALIGEGMAFYNLPYPIYSFLLVISSAGLPTAISKIISDRQALGDEAGAAVVFKIAKRILVLTGLLATLAMFLLAVPLSTAFGDPTAALTFRMMSPALFFTCLISAYRGYFQGTRRMSPTALSQLVEQFGKVLLGFPLAAYGMRYSPLYGAAGAVAGLVLSELAAMIFMLGVAAANRWQQKRRAPQPTLRPRAQESTGQIIKAIFALAIPVCIGACIMPMSGIIDSALVLNRLQDKGMTIEQARESYNALTTIATSLFGMPTVFTVALSTSLVPAISRAAALNHLQNTRNLSKFSLRLTALFSLPAAVGMGLLAHPIVEFLFGSQTAYAKTLGAQLLQWMSMGIFFVSVMQTTTGALQGLGKTLYPVCSMIAGVLVKLILSNALLQTSLGIYGVPIATTACYLTAMIGNLIYIHKFANIEASFLISFFRPLTAAGIMGVVLIAARYLLQSHVGNRTYLLIAISLGMLAYALAAVALKAVSREDLPYLPGSPKLHQVLKRFLR